MRSIAVLHVGQFCAEVITYSVSMPKYSLNKQIMKCYILLFKNKGWGRGAYLGRVGSVILLQIVMVSPGTYLEKNHESQSRTN